MMRTNTQYLLTFFLDFLDECRLPVGLSVPLRGSNVFVFGVTEKKYSSGTRKPESSITLSIVFSFPDKVWRVSVEFSSSISFPLFDWSNADVLNLSLTLSVVVRLEVSNGQHPLIRLPIDFLNFFDWPLEERLKSLSISFPLLSVCLWSFFNLKRGEMSKKIKISAFLLPLRTRS